MSQVTEEYLCQSKKINDQVDIKCHYNRQHIKCYSIGIKLCNTYPVYVQGHHVCFELSLYKKVQTTVMNPNQTLCVMT
jgi:hypothetical protein